MNIYVGNLARAATENDLKEIFEPFGTPTSIAIIKDKITHEPKGFAFVEMPTDDAGNKAIEGLNGTDLKGRLLKVNEARPKDDSRSNESRDNRFGNRSNRRY